MKWFKIDKDFIKRAVFAITILFIAWLMFSCSGCSTADTPVVEQEAVVEETPVVEPTPVEVIKEAVKPVEEPVEAPAELIVEPVVTPSDTTPVSE